MRENHCELVTPALHLFLIPLKPLIYLVFLPPYYLDMVEVASSNLAGPTKHKRAR